MAISNLSRDIHKRKHHTFQLLSLAARSLISSPTKASNMAPKGNIQKLNQTWHFSTSIGMVASKMY